MHRSLVFQWALAGFLFGIALASFLILPAWIAWMLLGLGMVALISNRSASFIVGIVCIGTVLGIWRTNSVLNVPSKIWDLAGQRQAVELAGYVDGDFVPTKNGGQYPFRVTAIDGISSSDRIMVFGPDSLRPRFGQVLVLSGKLQQPKTKDFDYASYLAKDGMHGLMYSPQYSVPLDWQPSFWTRIRLAAIGRLHRVRDSIASSITKSVAQPYAAYLAGILVGAQGIVPADIKEMFSRTGTSHILAISGYNITIVTSVLIMLLRPLGRRRAFWSASAGVAVFTIMVGASASVVRAAIMGVLAMSALQSGRQVRPGILILLSAAIMCGISPFLLRWDIGFQLSFLALIGIIYIEPLIKPALVKVLRWEVLAGTVSTTLSASIAVLPLLLHDFGQLAVYTLPANVLVLPLVPLAMALAFATALAGLVMPILGQVIGQLAWLVAFFQLGVIRFFSNLPYAAIKVDFSVIALIAAYAAIATWLIAEGVSRVRSRPPASLTTKERIV